MCQFQSYCTFAFLLVSYKLLEAFLLAFLQSEGHPILRRVWAGGKVSQVVCEWLNVLWHRKHANWIPDLPVSINGLQEALLTRAAPLHQLRSPQPSASWFRFPVRQFDSSPHPRLVSAHWRSDLSTRRFQHVFLLLVRAVGCHTPVDAAFLAVTGFDQFYRGHLALLYYHYIGFQRTLPSWHTPLSVLPTFLRRSRILQSSQVHRGSTLTNSQNVDSDESYVSDPFLAAFRQLGRCHFWQRCHYWLHCF